MDRAVLAATLDLLAEHGYGELSIEAVARAAHVGKASIYRRWASKAHLVGAAAEALATEVPDPDTGSLQGDLTAIAHGLGEILRRPGTGRLVAALVDRIARDPELAAQLRGGFLASRRAVARRALERGVARGEVAADVDLDLLVDLVAAPLYYRALITGDPIEEPYLDAVVAVAVSSARSAPGGAAAR